MLTPIHKVHYEQKLGGEGRGGVLNLPTGCVALGFTKVLHDKNNTQSCTMFYKPTVHSMLCCIFPHVEPRALVALSLHMQVI